MAQGLAFHLKVTQGTESRYGRPLYIYFERRRYIEQNLIIQIKPAYLLGKYSSYERARKVCLLSPRSGCANIDGHEFQVYSQRLPDQ